MPGGDRTGPMGAGPRSGRAAGYCAGFGAPGYMNPGSRRGFGGGRGFRGFGGGGHGWRHWFHATGLPGWLRFGDHQPPLPETERRMLEDQAEALKTELSSIEERLSQLESETKQK